VYIYAQYAQIAAQYAPIRILADNMHILHVYIAYHPYLQCIYMHFLCIYLHILCIFVHM
jgi:hypothetical protein